MGDSLGDRIKRYEAAYNQKLTPRMPVMIRVDGRAFHTLTKDMDRPFDFTLMSAMEWATGGTAREMQGFKLAYTQSDEATFLIADTDNYDTQGWFNYAVNKLVSLSASIFTAYFNDFMKFWDKPVLATFDARAFNIPAEDAPNAFIWRQRDWERNSLQMLARHHFPHKELHGKKRHELHEMLHGIGVNWAHLTPRERNGTFILRDGTVVQEKADYEQIATWIDPDRDAGVLGERQEHQSA